MVWLYERYQSTVFPDRNRERFVATYLPQSPQQRILDLGCGPAVYTKYLVYQTYVGVDLDRSAIIRSQRLFPPGFDTQGPIDHNSSNQRTTTFVVGSAETVINIPEVQHSAPYDVIFAHGLLHHLNDQQAKTTLGFCKELLTPTGVLVTADPCFFEGQHPISRLVTSYDRGQFVRTIDAHLNLFSTSFPAFTSSRDDSLLIFPFDLLVVRAQNTP